MATDIPTDLQSVPPSVVETPQPVNTTPVPGENLQNAIEHGEYLLDFPILSVSLDFAELVSSFKIYTILLDFI